MAKILVTGGSGHMGRRAVRSLVEAGNEVIVGDRQPPVDAGGAQFRPIDVLDADALAAACGDADAVLNFVGPFYRFGTLVAQAAIQARTPYVDVCDDADTTEELLALDAAAREAGCPVVVGAGMSPGVLNAVAQCTAANLEEVDEILTAWVVDEASESGTAPLDHFFHGISEDIPIWRDGRREVVRPFTAASAESFPFPEPIGPVEVRDIGHPETVTLPRSITARSVRNKGALLPPQSSPIFQTLAGIGLLSDATVEVRGVEVRARDFVVAFLTQRHNARGGTASGDRSAMGVRVTGTRGGQPVKRFVSFAKQLTMADSTALPAVAALDVLLGDSLPAGVHGPEVLGPERWFDAITRVAGDLFDGMLVWEGDDDASASSVPLAGLVAELERRS
jgi:saccharopine dehydrogenase-like NADP-dependent oxidoreductase